MKITIYCLKGSAGKTPIAVNIALEHGYALGTNEPYNILDMVIPEERLLSIEPQEEFPELPDDIDIVFDLAGMLSREAHKSIVTAVGQSDVVLVPVYNEMKCINAAISTIKELQPLTDKIVVVATKLQRGRHETFKSWTESSDFKNIQAVVHEYTSDKIPVLPLKFSKVFDTIFEKEKSIGQLRSESALFNYTYREVGDQFDSLFDYLKANYAT